MKKMVLIATTVFVTAYLAGCGSNSRTEDSDITSETAVEDVVTTISVDLSPKLETSFGEVFEDEPVADFSKYGDSYAACRFWKLGETAGDGSEVTGIFKEGNLQEPVTEIKEVSNDKFDMTEDGGFSFESGTFRAFLVKVEDKDFYLLFADNYGIDFLTLNGKNVNLLASYTGISLSELASHTGMPEEELVAAIESDAVYENEACVLEIERVAGILNDWSDFTFNVYEYAENENAMLPKEFVDSAIAEKEAERALALEQEEKEYRDMGAVKLLVASEEVYRTDTELSEKEVETLKEKGTVSDFGLQLDGEEYVSGYMITTYTLEDGTSVIPNQTTDSEDEYGGIPSFVTESEEVYVLAGLNFDSEAGYGVIWVVPEESLKKMMEQEESEGQPAE